MGRYWQNTVSSYVGTTVGGNDGSRKPGSSYINVDKLEGQNGQGSSTFTQPSYAPGALEPRQNPDGSTSQKMPVDYWAAQLASRARTVTPYLYPKPPPVINPVAYSEDDLRFAPAYKIREEGPATVMDGIAHDAILSQPIGADGAIALISNNDPIYRKVKADSAGVNAKVEYGKLPQWQKDAWAAAAEALGGGPRTASSTFTIYFNRSADASTGNGTGVGKNMTAWDFLNVDVASGELPEGVLKGDASGGSSGYGGYGGYGGGGYGGGGGGGAQVNLMNEQDARAVVNSLAADMLGRTVTEKEFRAYYKNLLQLQKQNPTTVEFGEDGSVTTQSPIGPDGLRYNLEEQMRNDEDFVTNSVGKQGLDLLEAFIAKKRMG